MQLGKVNYIFVIGDAISLPWEDVSAKQLDCAAYYILVLNVHPFSGQATIF